MRSAERERPSDARASSQIKHIQSSDLAGNTDNAADIAGTADNAGNAKNAAGNADNAGNTTSKLGNTNNAVKKNTKEKSIPQPSVEIKIRGKIVFPEGYPPGDRVVLYVSKGEIGSSQKNAPKTWTIDQKNYQFSPAFVVAHPQDTLVFKNSDPDLHTVVSHSGPLGGQTITTLKGQSRTVPLKESGHSEILCGIHAQMRADLLVIPTRNFIISRPSGIFEGTLKNVSFPLEIEIWHPILVSAPLNLLEAPPKGRALNVSLHPQN